MSRADRSDYGCDELVWNAVTTAKETVDSLLHEWDERYSVDFSENIRNSSFWFVSRARTCTRSMRWKDDNFLFWRLR